MDHKICLPLLSEVLIVSAAKDKVQELQKWLTLGNRCPKQHAPKAPSLLLGDTTCTLGYCTVITATNHRTPSHPTLVLDMLCTTIYTMYIQYIYCINTYTILILIWSICILYGWSLSEDCISSRLSFREPPGIRGSTLLSTCIHHCMAGAH